MKCKLFQLSDQLRKAPVHLGLVSGSEPLLIQDATRQIRSAMQSRDAQEHMHKLVLTDEDIETVLDETTTGSLFASSRVCEIYCQFDPKTKKTHNLLNRLVQSADATTQVLLICNKLDRAATTKAWVKHIEAQGLWVEIWPLTEQEHTKWISQSLQQHQLGISKDALQLLFELTVGNLSSAHQEIQKLALLYPKQHQLELDDILASTADNARFSLYNLVDEALQGKHKSVAHAWDQLKHSGTQPIEIFWHINRSLHELHQLAQAMADQENRRDVARRLKIFPSKLTVYEKALSRLSLRTITQFIRYASALDTLIKGLRQGDAEQGTQALLLAIAGVPSPALLLLYPRGQFHT